MTEKYRIHRLTKARLLEVDNAIVDFVYRNDKCTMEAITDNVKLVNRDTVRRRIEKLNMNGCIENVGSKKAFAYRIR